MSNLRAQRSERRITRALHLNAGILTVLHIRALMQQGYSTYGIARLFGISEARVWNVLARAS